MSIADQIAHMVMEQTADLRAELVKCRRQRDAYRRQRNELAESAKQLITYVDYGSGKEYYDPGLSAILMVIEAENQ